MNLKTNYFGLLILILTSCNKEQKYVPNGLIKLTENELILRAKNQESIDFEKISYKNEKGEVFTLDSVRNFPKTNEWIFDRYANEKGIIKELIIRKATPKDKELLAKIQQAYNYEPPIQLIDIDCDKKAEILEAIYLLDQNMRSSDNHEDYDPKIDRQNLTKVVSLIEKCGMPTTKEVNTIWLVLQHADNENRKKYFPLLKKAAYNGYLTKSKIAIMEDRILMTDGKPQIYGSQITENRETKKWEIYDLKDPKFVDKRRAKVGLKPLKEYTKDFDVQFNIKQEQ